MMIELSFAVLKTERKLQEIFQGFYPEKNSFRSCFWDGSTENLEIMGLA